MTFVQCLSRTANVKTLKYVILSLWQSPHPVVLVTGFNNITQITRLSSV